MIGSNGKPVAPAASRYIPSSVFDEFTSETTPSRPRQRRISFTVALSNDGGWSLGSIDQARKSGLVDIVYKSGRPYIRIL